MLEGGISNTLKPARKLSSFENKQLILCMDGGEGII